MLPMKLFCTFFFDTSLRCQASSSQKYCQVWRSSGDVHGAYKQCKKHISLWNLLLAKRWNVINTRSACRFIILLKQQNHKFRMHWMTTWESDTEARANNGTCNARYWKVCKKRTRRSGWRLPVWQRLASHFGKWLNVALLTGSHP